MAKVPRNLRCQAWVSGCAVLTRKAGSPGARVRTPPAHFSPKIPGCPAMGTRGPPRRGGRQQQKPQARGPGGHSPGCPNTRARRPVRPRRGSASSARGRRLGRGRQNAAPKMDSGAQPPHKRTCEEESICDLQLHARKSYHYTAADLAIIGQLGQEIKKAARAGIGPAGKS